MKIKNNETDEILTFNDDWVVVEEKQPLIQGEKYIEMFKKWVKCCGDDDWWTRKVQRYKYVKSRDILQFDARDEEDCYGISFNTTTIYENLKDGQKYSYNELVGE